MKIISVEEGCLGLHVARVCKRFTVDISRVHGFPCSSEARVHHSVIGGKTDGQRVAGRNHVCWRLCAAVCS